MIASNYRKFPEAMALQLVLAFGACIWHTARPTTRAGRAIRAARGHLVKKTPQLVNWAKVPTPKWWKDAKTAAKRLADQVREAIGRLVWDIEQQTAKESHLSEPQKIEVTTDPIELLKDQAAALRHIRGMPTPFTYNLKWNKYAHWQHYGTEENLFPVCRAQGYRT